MSSHRPSRSRRRPAFHGGSFAAGVVLGVLLTVTGVLLPDLLDEEVTTAPPTATAVAPVTPRFEFFDSLPKSRVPTDPRPYQAATPRRESAAAPAPAPAAAPGVEYLLQAGSFTTRADADNLRDTLADLGLPANTVLAQLPNGVERHRVIIGPFAAEPDVRRAQTTLRERNIDALMLARRPANG
jgi:cell division protein FtsN